MKVLLIEDELETADAIASYLRIHKLDVSVALTLQQAEFFLDSETPDMVVLDIEMPDGNGLQWLKKNSEILSQTGLVVVSAHHFEAMRIKALELGTDVFLRKPLAAQELLLQLQNLANRLRLADDGDAQPSSWQLDLKQWQLTSPNSQSLSLTLSEIRLLKCLAQAAFRPVERDDIIRGLGNDPSYYDQRRLETMIRRLRQKAEEALKDEVFPLITVRGVGYSFKDFIQIQRA